MNLPQLPQDKANHFVYGAALYCALSLLHAACVLAEGLPPPVEYLLRSVGLVVLVGAVGVGWEIWAKGVRDWWDAVATAAGAAVAAVPLSLTMLLVLHVIYG